MKTFLLNIPKRLRIESQKLDAQAFLCDRAWTVFNDEGVKQLFIFQTDGSLLITINGEVYNSTWKYLTVNNSVVITSEGKSRMFHPAFMDSIVFALEQDGGAECLFMIDEVNQKAFLPKTLTELQLYFQRKEQALIEQEKRQKEYEEQQRREQIKKQIEDQEQQKIKEVENNRLYQEQISREREHEIKENADKLAEALSPWDDYITWIIAAIASGIYTFFYWKSISPISTEDYLDILKNSVSCFAVIGFLVAMVYLLLKTISIKHWKDDHPDDPRNKYL